MAKKIPPHRKLEIAFAGYLVDRQKADPAFLPGFSIVCGTTGRSPDDLDPANGAPTEPALPYIAVACQHVKAHSNFPSGYGMKEADVVVYCKTHASDEARANADEREAEIAEHLEDAPAILAALNQPPDADTPDTRRQKDLYLYAAEDLEINDAASGIAPGRGLLPPSRG